VTDSINSAIGHHLVEGPSLDQVTGDTVGVIPTFTTGVMEGLTRVVLLIPDVTDSGQLGQGRREVIQDPGR
jgi:hypothetical protein